MTPEQLEWSRTRGELVSVIKALGFPEKLGSEIAKILGSPKAMRRMISYLYYVNISVYLLKLADIWGDPEALQLILCHIKKGKFLLVSLQKSFLILRLVIAPAVADVLLVFREIIADFL